jgi:predicted transcriptional regulator
LSDEKTKESQGFAGRKIRMSDAKPPGHILALTAQIVSAHVAHNTVAAAALPALIQEVHRALASIEGGAPSLAKHPEPRVAIAKSITPDYIICLEDGKKLKMLKRHLKSAFNMTPEQYRERWGLPVDYPMVAPRYAKQRSTLAKKIGLGTKAPRRKVVSG